MIGILVAMAFGQMSLLAQDFKEVTFDEFFGDQIASIPLSFEIPAEYDHAEEIDAPLTYSYWMRGEDVAGAIETEELPKQSGYIYGKISLSVAYESETKKFTMEENLEDELKKAGMTLLEQTRFDVGEHPIWAYIAKKDDVVICAMYVATGIDSNVVYFGYQPGKHKIEVIKAKWKRIVESLKLASD